MLAFLKKEEGKLIFLFVLATFFCIATFQQWQRLPLLRGPCPQSSSCTLVVLFALELQLVLARDQLSLMLRLLSCRRTHRLRMRRLCCSRLALAGSMSW